MKAWSALHPDHCILFSIHLIGDSMGPTASLDALNKRKFTCSCQELNHNCHYRNEIQWFSWILWNRCRITYKCINVHYFQLQNPSYWLCTITGLPSIMIILKITYNKVILLQSQNRYNQNPCKFLTLHYEQISNKFFGRHTSALAEKIAWLNKYIQSIKVTDRQ
jgi:hypothetical protein